MFFASNFTGKFLDLELFIFLGSTAKNQTKIIKAQIRLFKKQAFNNILLFNGRNRYIG